MTSTEQDIVIIAYGASLVPEETTPSQVFYDFVKSLDVNVITVLGVSSLWRSQAWPNPSDPPFYNAVFLCKTHLNPYDLLNYLHGLEAAAGRVRTVPNAPRTLDLDIIACGRAVSEASPILPHPRAHERAFVMGPLSEVWPDWRHPVTGEAAISLYDSASVGRDAAPFDPPPALASK